MPFKLNLLHHSHSGRLRGHEHTSYVPLLFLLALTGWVLVSYTAANAASPGPEAGSIGISGQVPAKPPTTAATILKPIDGQRFTESPIEVSGTCPASTLVELYKNDIFAGSTICSADGKYSLSVDLLIGQNILIARVYDSLNQPGPDSKAVTVFYDALPPQANPLFPLSFGADQLILNTDAVFRGTFPNQEMTMPVNIIGGTPPYALNIQWGDGTNKVISRNDNDTFRVAHTYKKAGVYQITLQATDANERVAFLTVAAIINGQPAGKTTTTTTPTTEQNLLIALWPLYLALIVAFTSFWLGERREKHILAKRGLLLQA